MPIKKDNQFTEYDLTEQDIQEGSLLSQATVAVLQNLLADVSRERVNMLFDPSEPLLYTQAEAETRGRMYILQTLLANSEEAHSKLVTDAVVHASLEPTDYSINPYSDLSMF